MQRRKPPIRVSALTKNQKARKDGKKGLLVQIPCMINCEFHVSGQRPAVGLILRLLVIWVMMEAIPTRAML
jgi:hypothetical protein